MIIFEWLESDELQLASLRERRDTGRGTAGNICCGKQRLVKIISLRCSILVLQIELSPRKCLLMIIHNPNNM